jgi:acyl transferase domain-containing protein/phosphopantetheinyl transferase
VSEHGVAIAIVGMAAIFPGAPDLARFWRNLVGGVDAISEVPASRWDPSYYDPSAWTAPGQAVGDRFYCRRGGFVDELATFDPARFGIMPVAVEGAEPDQLLALRVAADALADAGADAGRLPDRQRIGVVLGRGGYLGAGLARLDQRVRTARQLEATLEELLPELPAERLAQVRAAFQARLGPERPEASIGLVPNLAASRIANRLDLRGPAYTVDAACASSLVAVDQAVAELRSGRCDAMLAGGVHHCHDVTLWSVFTQLRALSPSQRIRPFDRGADGLLIGEGTGIVALKRLEDAERDGDRVYAVIRGVGVASDGRAASLMAPLPDGQVLALERAWRQAGLDPTEPGAFGLLEAHGTATPAGDAAELATLTRVFGSRGAAGGSGRIGLGSVKSMIGHAMPAAGIAGLIKAALAVHHRVLPPTLHCDDPHPALASSRFVPVTAATPWEAPSGGRVPRRAAVNAFGFGGINAHVLLEEAPGGHGAAAVPAPLRATATPVDNPNATPCEPARLPSGGPPEGVAADASGRRAEQVLLLAGATPGDLLRQLDALDGGALDLTGGGGHDGGPCRLALFGANTRQLALARKVVAQGRPWRGRHDLWFTATPLFGRHARDPAKLAFLFPGLEPGFRPDLVSDVADHFGLRRPPLDGAEAVGRHGVAVVAVGRLLDAALRALGVIPDLVAGHSVGEWTAMITAELYPREAVDRFLASFDADALRVPQVVFAALGCGADTAAAAIDGLGQVVVSHDNCPHQSIICGEQASVAAALERLRAQGVIGQPLPFRSGFHTPMLAPYLDQARQALADLPVQAPLVPVWSATTVAPYPSDPAEVRALVLRHLLEPVRFRALIERLHQQGVRGFVQVGSGSLSGFVSDTLQGRDHLTVTAVVPGRPALAQLRRVAAALWVEGMAPRFDHLPAAASTAPAAATPPATSPRLDLGAPLITLGGTVEPLAIAATPSTRHAATGLGVAPQAAGHPVLAELDAALREATDAARLVTAAWERGSAAPPAPAAPTGNGARRPTQPRQAATTRVLSLETMPFLRDHCLFPQPDGWPEMADRFPVVPMTTLVELMAATARELVPGRAVAAVEDVRARRWLAVAPPVTVTTRACFDGADRVTVSIESAGHEREAAATQAGSPPPGQPGGGAPVGYARGTVVLAGPDTVAAPPGPSGEPLTRERPAELSASQLYQDRWMFHGPAFQGVTALGPIADDGIRGTLRSLPAPGALLDNAGQLMGYWVMASTVVDRLALPATIERVRFHGLQPPPGEAVGCTVWIRALSASAVRADMELRRADGRVWAQVEGWEDRRFASDEVVWPALFHPSRCGVAQPQPGGWVLVRERWPDAAARELMARRYLDSAERAAHERRNPRGQRQWLLGRIAVKDAVRQWLWARGAGPLFPVEIHVEADPQGRPYVALPAKLGFAGELAVSLAHSGPLAAAIVRPRRRDPRPASEHDAGGGVGIDLEAVAAHGPGMAALAFGAEELALLDRLEPLPAWSIRFWAAKEAVAKAEGTGLRGHPHRFAVRCVRGDRLLVHAQVPGGRAHWVETRLVNDPAGDHAKGTPAIYAVAWTTTAAETAPGEEGDTDGT